MTLPRCGWALVAVVLVPRPAYGQPAPADVLPPTTAAPSTASPLMPSVRTALGALGAGSGVPDGVGGGWYPSRPVRSQPVRVGLGNFQAGLTLPAYDTGADSVFANSSAQVLT